MPTAQLLKLAIKVPDRLNGGLHLCGEGVDHEHGGVQHCLICGQRHSRFDGRQPVGERLFAYGVMRVKELFEGRGPDLLNRCEGGPTEQKLTDECSADIIKPLYNLRKIG